MKNGITASAPGKLILIGEHAVVYGNHALIAAINLYAECHAMQTSRGLQICLKNYDYIARFSWKKIFTEYQARKTLHKNFLGTQDKKLLERKEPALLIILVIASLLEYTDYKPDTGIKLIISSQVPIGGFGASSAAGAAVIKVLIKIWGLKLNTEELISILVNAEMLFHGRVSGADQATVLLNGLVKFHKDKSGEPHYEKVSAKSALLKECIVVDSGTPADTTGQAVDFVRKNYEKKKKAVSAIFTELERLSEAILLALSNDDSRLFYTSISRSGELLEKLDVVTPATRKLTSSLKKLGGAVKLSGAGSITGKGSGAVLCFAENKNQKQILNWLQQLGYKYYLLDLAS